MDEQTKADEGAQDPGAGDVETAGETTAADTISGPADTRPVGAGTTAPVEDAPKPSHETGD